VADNASTDDSVTFIKENYPNIKLIELTKNEGFAKGYNEALKQIDSAYYVLLNQDVEVTPNWIEPVIDLMEKDNQVAACQPKIKAFHKKTHFEYAGAAGGFMDKYGYTFCRGRLFDKLEEDKGQYNQASEIFWASGACCFIRSSLYHELGGLDADLFAHMEEIDLCWRLKNAGYKIMYCPESTVYHVGGGSLPQGNPRKTFLNFRNNLVIMVKNLPFGSMLYKIPLRLLLDHIAAYKALFSGHVKEYLAIAKAHFLFHLFILKWLGKRSQSRKSVSNPNNEGIYQRSIVLDFFLRKKRKFSDLPF